jgi:hypothetical protein
VHSSTRRGGDDGDAGATRRTPLALIDAVEVGQIAGAWSSGGVTRAGRHTELRFVVPASGAVVLPGFVGIVAETEMADAAYRWLDYRLDTRIQSDMTFGELSWRIGTETPVPHVPVVDVGRDARPYTGFDPHAGDAYAIFDWKLVGASADIVMTRVRALVEGGA